MAIQINCDKICGICLQESNNMISIFDQDDTQMTISEKIEKCFPGYSNLQAPSQICELCLQDLSAAFRFHTHCETALLLFRCSPISHELESSTCVQIKEVHQELNGESPSCDELQKLEPSQDDSSNTLAQETEYGDLCELEYSYDEEHLESAYEAIEDIPNLGSETETNALDNEIKNQQDATYTPIDENTVKVARKRLKNRNPKLQAFKPHKKGKDKGVHSPKICEICGNTYKYQHALNSHMRRHMNEKPFSCECCDKAFVSNVELRRHMRVHTGDKPYRCNFCERRFSDYGSRIKHERTHTGERPFICQTCHKSFAYAHVLSVHLRTHTGEKKFQCTQCEKGFTKKSYMLAHLEQHKRTALLVLKEEESRDDYVHQQMKTISSNALDSSEDHSMGPCTTTYIVEEIDGDNSDVKVFKDIVKVGNQLQGVSCNETILGLT